MQSPRVKRLGEQILKVRNRVDRRGRQTPWRVVCLKVRPKILKADGAPDTGLAYQIGVNKKEPDRAVQERLGLPAVCSKCHRRLPKLRSKRVVVKSPARLWWESLSHQKQEAILSRLHTLENLL